MSLPPCRCPECQALYASLSMETATGEALDALMSITAVSEEEIRAIRGWIQPAPREMVLRDIFPPYWEHEDAIFHSASWFTVVFS